MTNPLGIIDPPHECDEFGHPQSPSEALLSHESIHGRAMIICGGVDREPVPLPPHECLNIGTGGCVSGPYCPKKARAWVKYSRFVVNQ